MQHPTFRLHLAARKKNRTGAHLQGLVAGQIENEMIPCPDIAHPSAPLDGTEIASASTRLANGFCW